MTPVWAKKTGPRGLENQFPTRAHQFSKCWIRKPMFMTFGVTLEKRCFDQKSQLLVFLPDAFFGKEKLSFGVLKSLRDPSRKLRLEILCISGSITSHLGGWVPSSDLLKFELLLQQQPRGGAPELGIYVGLFLGYVLAPLGPFLGP